MQLWKLSRPKREELNRADLSNGRIGVPEEQARHLVVLCIWIAIEGYQLSHEGSLLKKKLGKGGERTRKN